MIQRVHHMPFGAELRSDGSARFRLWAPAVRRVELLLGEAEGQRLPMQPLEDGRFELETRAARAGSRYRYRVDERLVVPDPAARFNPDDVHGASELIDPASFEWSDAEWRGRPWHEAVTYELHVGTYTPSGDYRSIMERLDHLAALGVTFIELMPLADFPGARNWGYDGVLLFAPDASYGRPEALKALIDAAHARGIGVLLDVVYNHFGPEGNFLHAYAPQFFTDRHQTPWGAAINFDAEASRMVRDFYVHNALYWLEEYHFDGLRFDAVHAIRDESKPHILTEIAHAVRAGPGRERHVHLVLENHANEVRFLGPPGGAGLFDAQWNDDMHHCLHVIVTGETDGYYADYAGRAHELLARCLGEGFAYQGERSTHGGGTPRGEPSAGLPPSAFVAFLQNHDQIGNRARGERIGQLVKEPAALRAALAILLLAPSPPLLFMGEEWNAAEPFTYFCDFEPALAAAVREGRRREFASFPAFAHATVPDTLPDAGAPETFEAAKLDWARPGRRPHREWLEWYRMLLGIRRREIAPRLAGVRPARLAQAAGTALAVEWVLNDGALLRLDANLGPRAAAFAAPASAGAADSSVRELLRVSKRRVRAGLGPWAAVWTLAEAGR